MSMEDNGIIHIASTHSVDEVLERLLSLLHMKAIMVFAVVDHSGEAKKAGIEMRNTKLVIFGNPRAGTPVMIAAPDSALDLPLKILIAQGPDGSTKVSYNAPAYLRTRFGLSPELADKLAVIDQIAAAIAG